MSDCHSHLKQMLCDTLPLGITWLHNVFVYVCVAPPMVNSASQLLLSREGHTKEEQVLLAHVATVKPAAALASIFLISS